MVINNIFGLDPLTFLVNSLVFIVIYGVIMVVGSIPVGYIINFLIEKLHRITDVFLDFKLLRKTDDTDDVSPEDEADGIRGNNAQNKR